ncbi:glycosyltransferase family 2 protein [Falsiroseomonas oryzae]|uniref:glycosyltransferase family 2 protein n=1 Tax=Falsiroseomonas oryzae TaxID=2766473 RepID=UPI0022EA190B|nr:glycosyltransferase family 2 protein [Roseomonas sp. MO-31]
MAVWLVTILYNSAEALPAFLGCLRAQTHGEWRLVAVDNASRDEGAAILEAAGDPRVTVLRNGRNLGFAAAVNQGLRHAAAARDGDVFLLLNNDTRFAPDFLAELLAARERHAAEVLAPRVMRLDDPGVSWYAGGDIDDGWVLHNTHDVHDEADATPHRLVGFASGCCLLLTRRVLDTVGLLDESFFVYWEDTDLSIRLGRAGIPIHYVRDPFLLHEGGGSSGGPRSPVVVRLFNRHHILLIRKYQGRAAALRSVARLLAKKLRQPHTHHGAWRDVVPAMLGGLVAPLKPVPRL